LVSLAKRNKSPKRKNHTKTMVHTMAQTGIPVVVVDRSETFHTKPPTGRVPLGVTTQDLDTIMSPTVTSGCSTTCDELAASGSGDGA
jgi:hypothetical protein